VLGREVTPFIKYWIASFKMFLFSNGFLNLKMRCCMKRLLLLLLVLSCMVLESCTRSTYLKKIDYFLNTSAVDAKSKCMAEEYRSFFMEKKGSGKSKSEALKSFQNWNASLHPDVKILEYTVNDNTWMVRFNEQNDFSKPIGYPGWKGSMMVRFNSKGLIQETIYVPDSANPSYRPWLQPALDWLQKNRPEELNAVYQNNKLVQNEAAAKKWRELLKAWQEQNSTRSTVGRDR
jgi:hypothetical protein